MVRFVEAKDGPFCKCAFTFITWGKGKGKGNLILKPNQNIAISCLCPLQIQNGPPSRPNNTPFYLFIAFPPCSHAQSFSHFSHVHLFKILLFPPFYVSFSRKNKMVIKFFFLWNILKLIGNVFYIYIYFLNNIVSSFRLAI